MFCFSEKIFRLLLGWRLFVSKWNREFVEVWDLFMNVMDEVVE